MVGSERTGPGGTRGLLDLVIEHEGAVRGDLVRDGLRLDWVGTPQLSWADFSAWLQVLPRTSATWQAINGPHYSPELQLLGLLVDASNIANWQRGRNPSAPKPKTNQWPWSKRADQETFGKAAPVDIVRDFLVYRNGRILGR